MKAEEKKEKKKEIVAWPTYLFPFSVEADSRVSGPIDMHYTGHYFVLLEIPRVWSCAHELAFANIEPPKWVAGFRKKENSRPWMERKIIISIPPPPSPRIARTFNCVCDPLSENTMAIIVCSMNNYLRIFFFHKAFNLQLFL